MRIKAVIFFLLFNVLAYAQDFRSKQNAPYTIRGNIGIPRTISSQMFRTCFNGVYEANLSVNARIFNNVFVGLGYQNSHHQNNKFLKFQYFRASIPYNTRFDTHSGFIKIGVDRFFSDDNYMSYSINSGLMQANYKNVNADTNKLNQPYGIQKYIVPYVQPELAVNFIVDEKKTMSLSIMISYTTLFGNFDPKAPRLNHFEEVNKKQNSYFMSWFNLGFGFAALINRKQSGAG
jgi:hypothetical protein